MKNLSKTDAIIANIAYGFFMKPTIALLLVIFLLSNTQIASAFEKVDSVKKAEVSKNYIIGSLSLGKHFYGYTVNNYNDIYGEIGLKKMVGIININKRKYDDYYNQDKIFAVGFKAPLKSGFFIPYTGFNLMDYSAVRIYKNTSNKILLKQVGQFQKTAFMVGIKGELNFNKVTLYVDRINHFFTSGSQEVGLKDVIDDWYLNVDNVMVIKHAQTTTLQSRLDYKLSIKGLEGISIGSYLYGWMQPELNKFSFAPYVSYQRSNFSGNVAYVSSDNTSAFMVSLRYQFDLK